MACIGGSTKRLKLVYTSTLPATATSTATVTVTVTVTSTVIVTVNVTVTPINWKKARNEAVTRRQSALFFFLTLLLSSFWTSRGHRCRLFPPPRVLASIFIAHRVQQSHCSSTFHRVLLTHALALSARQSVHKKKSPRFCTSMHSGRLELTKLTYTRLEDNLIRNRGDRTALLTLVSTPGQAILRLKTVCRRWLITPSVPIVSSFLVRSTWGSNPQVPKTNGADNSVDS